MKRFQKYWPTALLCAILAFAFTNTTTAPDEPFAGSLYEYSTADTITNAGNDTISITPYLISNWYYNLTLRANQASGTKNVILILQESNERSGDYWYEVERDTATGSGTTITRLYGSGLSDRVQGVRQRIILDGSGTQSTLYTVKLTLKK